MEDSIPDGIPSVSDYKKLVDSELFRGMEQYSNGFLATNGATFKSYMKKWVEDPLHQWSRQWEYPYVYEQIRKTLGDVKNPRILDAGSGITFFPHYLNDRINNASIHCCDYDNAISAVFKKLNEGSEREVGFSSADLRELPYESSSFNAVYCISVLEHTDEYERIIEEFCRILVPGGVMVITFDISMDGTRDIDYEKANVLLTSLSRIVEKDESASYDLRTRVVASDVFTTLTAHSMDANLLPWAPPSLLSKVKSFVLHGKVACPPPLTVYCITLTKPLDG